MVDYGKVRSTVKPSTIEIDDYSVWKNTDVQEVFENIGQENEFIGYEFHMVQYTKDEFILNQSVEIASLSQEVTEAQLAIVEVYENTIINE